MTQPTEKTVSRISSTTFSSNSVAFARPDDRPNIQSFAYSFRPIHYFSRAFGLLPFSVALDSNGNIQKARVSLFDALWFVISISLYLIMAFICYQNIKLPQDQNVSYILATGDAMFLIAGLIYGAIIITIDMFNRFRIIDILRMFTAFDSEV